MRYTGYARVHNRHAPSISAACRAGTQITGFGRRTANGHAPAKRLYVVWRCVQRIVPVFKRMGPAEPFGGIRAGLDPVTRMQCTLMASCCLAIGATAMAAPAHCIPGLLPLQRLCLWRQIAPALHSLMLSSTSPPPTFTASAPCMLGGWRWGGGCAKILRRAVATTTLFSPRLC